MATHGDKIGDVALGQLPRELVINYVHQGVYLFLGDPLYCVGTSGTV
jgi:hypothetical protein